MSSRVLALIALSCFLIAGTTARSQTSPSTAEPQLAQALKEIDSLLKQWGPETGPGCIYAAAKDGRTLFIRAYGRADLEQDVPIAAGSVFNAASIAKQFTAAAVLLLVQDGKLRLDDDIRKYLPEMPDYGTPITTRHLLNHTSGLREWSAVEELSGRPLIGASTTMPTFSKSLRGSEASTTLPARDGPTPIPDTFCWPLSRGG
jgi:CubicO group peptidase (beta-lactamase class C family)